MKKKLVFLCAIVSVIVLALFALSACDASSIDYDTELLQNGDFEDTSDTDGGFVFTGWSVGDEWNDDTSDYQRVNAASNDPESVGTQYLSLSNSKAGYAWLYQEVRVERREIYVISVDIKVSGTVTAGSNDTYKGAYVTFLENVDYIFSEVTRSAGDNGSNGW